MIKKRDYFVSLNNEKFNLKIELKKNKSQLLDHNFRNELNFGNNL